MGLMYQFPISTDEQDFVTIKETGTGKQVEIKSYGLPIIFWVYLSAILAVLSLLVLASWGPAKKLLSYPDPLNQIIVYSLLCTVVMTVLALLAFFFYIKIISYDGKYITFKHKVFGLQLLKKSYQVKTPLHWYVEHFLDSPNIAKKQNYPGSRGFQNKGHFQLFIETEQKKRTYIDRSSKKRDLERMANLLFNFQEIGDVRKSDS